MVHQLVFQAFATASLPLAFQRLKLSIPLSLLISLMLGWLMTIFFEKPIAKLIRRDHGLTNEKSKQEEDECTTRLLDPKVAGITEVASNSAEVMVVV